MADSLPTLRWGIIATGLISSWFVADLTLERDSAKANHIIQAVGSSSKEKGQAFVAKNLPGKSPAVYGSYEEVYADPNVDIVYIGTPHALHKQNCLDAIKAGKHVLCEKAFALNAADAQDVFDAAREKGVFIMEAMWTRFYPLVKTLTDMLHNQKVIGDVHRVFCDFGIDQKIASLGPESRLKNPALGAGTLLDTGIYSLTWGLLGLGTGTETPKIVAQQTLSDGIDIASSAILTFKGRQAIVTSSALVKTEPVFCRIEGSEGHILVQGVASSAPALFTVFLRDGSSKKHEFVRVGKGFYWEADAVALDIAAGKTQSDTMPWDETVRVLKMLDEIRRQGGAKFPQDRI